ncbi:MAG: putative CxxxxCH...CXXCH cytochrome family protein [Candidatus Latescibacterota bacterium]|jgi:predicted CxxxxCH...CXXCH cytochrome family protein
MMRIHTTAITLLSSALLGLSACSELSNEPAPIGPAASAHPEGWIDPAAVESFHGDAIRMANWDMESCQSCHGVDYAGGLVERSCITCHANTPEGCTTCHGAAGSGIAPPQDTNNNIDAIFYGVGAHQVHLKGGILGAVVECAECHTLPEGFADPAHIDGDGRAELVWGTFATQDGALNPHYDPESNSCSDTYCHSGGKFGANPTVKWTEVGTGQADCGTCHTNPPGPDTGHPNVPESLTCNICHGNVVDADNNIINSDLHLNGQTDL